MQLFTRLTSTASNSIIAISFLSVVAAVQPDANTVRSSEAETVDVQKRSGTIHCANRGKLKYVKGLCNPRNSRGWLSAHNCERKGGTAYLCVQNNVGTCFSLRHGHQAYEGGECFL
ncbi:hypothetical protein CPC08DRAFT_713453 [Agrocybe pediades]|nr:hypothetical protein CPC08DRAFT_713453 [Agrocybe pediades]